MSNERSDKRSRNSKENRKSAGNKKGLQGLFRQSNEKVATIKKIKSSDGTPRHGTSNTNVAGSGLAPGGGSQDYIYNDPKETALNPSQRDNIRKLALEIMSGGVDKLKKEFDQLKSFKPPDASKTAMMANLKKCRYKDVACWDRTRIRLSFPPDDPNDFIHANLVKHESLFNQFICCQGPLESTVIDFWRLVWQERCCLIVMLCQCIEVKKPKCAQYWPLAPNETKVVGPFIITTLEVDTSDPNVTLTRMTLQCNSDMRQVEHRHWVSWPDKTVPKSSAVAFRLLTFPRETPNNPTLIHCSAGVGRTGTLVLLEMIQRILLGSHGNKIVIPQLLKELRSQRSQSVQTEDQYVYVHFSMVQYSVMRRVVTKEEIVGFIKEYENYLKSVDTTHKSKKKKASAVSSTPKRTSAENVDDHDDDDDLPAPSPGAAAAQGPVPPIPTGCSKMGQVSAEPIPFSSTPRKGNRVSKANPAQDQQGPGVPMPPPFPSDPPAS